MTDILVLVAASIIVLVPFVIQGALVLIAILLIVSAARWLLDYPIRSNP